MNKKKALKMSPVMNVPAPLLMTKEYKQPIFFTVKYNGSQIFLYKKDLIELDLSQQISDFKDKEKYFSFHFTDGCFYLYFSKNEYYYQICELFDYIFYIQKDDAIFLDSDGKEYSANFIEVNDRHVFIEIAPKRKI